MKVLIICYCYPPDLGPRAFRWSAIAEYWADKGIEVHVVSGRKPGAASYENLSGVHVYRCGGAFTDNLRARIERRRHAKPSNHKKSLPDDALKSRKGGIGVGMLKRLHDLTWKKIYWPESTCLWFFPAWSTTKRLLAENDFNVLISSSTPYTGHLVGHAAKRRKPTLHWMVDIGDPFSFFHVMPWNNEALYRRLNHSSEHAVLRDADSISVTVQSCLDTYVDTFPDLDIAAKTTVIPPLLSNPGMETANRSPRNGGGLRLVFTGALYGTIRNPTYMLELFSRICERRPNDELHLFGSVNDCGPCFEPFHGMLQKNLFVYGRVSRDIAQSETESADVLVNIGNETPYLLPSKIVDYIATGKPILNLVYGPDDSSQRILDDYPAHLAIAMDEDGPSPETVDRFVDFLENTQPVNLGLLDDFLNRFRVDRIADSYRTATGIKDF
jgi:hypothetical protein